MNLLFSTLLLLALAFNSLCISAQMLLGSVFLNSSVGSPTSKFHHNITTATSVASRPQSCGICDVGGPNVDVYYWPQPDVNTSCLSIIGPTPSPPLAGATTSNGVTYWGSTETDAPHDYLMTMLLTAVNGITFKVPLQDPWPYTVTGMGPVNYTLQEPLGKRAHATRNPFFLEPRAPFNESRGSLLSNEGNRTLVESTVVYNGHTMTSPSIYANFYSLTAADSCGPLGGGPDGVIKSTLIAFAPGELSTFGGPLNEWLHGMQPGLTSYILPYNFADLPCPPYKTMTDQWYKPEPGQPYRPIIAFPSKVLDVDPLWKSCTPRFFTGLDPPIVLHPATALAPLVTPAANANPDPIEAKPSPSSENLPAKTAQPPAQKIQPARNTGVPKPPNDPKAQNGGEIKPEVAADPGTTKGDSSLIDPKVGSGAAGGETKPEVAADPKMFKGDSSSIYSKVGSGATGGETKPEVAADPGMFKGDSSSIYSKVGSGATDVAMNSPSENEAGNPVAKLTPQVQSAAGVDENKNSGSESTAVHSPKEDGDLSSMSDSASAGFASGTNDIEQPSPIATAGGEPIVAISQHTPSEEHGTGEPGASGGESQNNPNGKTADEPHTEESDPLVDPEMNDPHSGIATASQAYTNNDPTMTPSPFTTTIGRHVVQALSNPGAILVDGEPITLGRGSKVVSGTPIALQQDGGLIIGTSTIRNLLPNPLPTPKFPFTFSDGILATDQNSRDTTSYPTSAPQVYRIGSVNVTAGGPPITYSGTKIQAFNGGSIVVGDSTYHATPTPAAVKAVGGVEDPDISGTSAPIISSGYESFKANNSTVSESGDALNASTASVMPYQGSGTKGSVGWSLLCGLIMIALTGQLRL